MSNQRAALVTGGTRGIGLAIATMLGEEGHAVTVTARNPEGVEGVTAELARQGVDVLGVVADVSRRDDVERLLDVHAARFGRLDVLVNNAGTFVGGSVGSLDPDAFDTQLAANLGSTFLVAKAAIPLLRQAGEEHGRALLVNVSSVLGHYGQAISAGYSASKAGVHALTQALHAELAPAGVRVTALSPAFVATDMTAALPFPREELIQASDLAEAVRFLLRTSPACVVPEIPFMRTADRVYSAV